MTLRPLTPLTRRTALARGLTSMGLLGLSSAAAFAQSEINKNKLYVQLRGNLDASDGLWAYRGAYWGKPEGEIARRLFRVDGLSFNAMTLRADGGVEQKMIECGFWQDPQTGELADNWVNPINGLDCQPKHFKSSQTLSFDANGQLEAPEGRDGPSPYVEGLITAPVIDGSAIWSQERLLSKFNRPDPSPDADPLTYGGPLAAGASLVTYLADVNDLDSSFVPTTMHYQSMNSWYPWMRMGQRAGMCSFELFGRKLASTAEIPAHVKALLDDRRPGFIDDPWA